MWHRVGTMVHWVAWMTGGDPGGGTPGGAGLGGSGTGGGTPGVAGLRGVSDGGCCGLGRLWEAPLEEAYSLGGWHGA